MRANGTVPRTKVRAQRMHSGLDIWRVPLGFEAYSNSFENVSQSIGKFRSSSLEPAVHRIPGAFRNQETYILFIEQFLLANSRVKMNTTNSIRFAAITVAIAITAIVQGTMLWSFDSVAQQATQQPEIQVTMKAATGQNS